jgi:hypothetical protein
MASFKPKALKVLIFMCGDGIGGAYWTKRRTFDLTFHIDK